MGGSFPKTTSAPIFTTSIPVAPGEETRVLIDGLWQAAGVTGPENGKYGLSAEIVADAIQAEPATP